MLLLQSACNGSIGDDDAAGGGDGSSGHGGAADGARPGAGDSGDPGASGTSASSSGSGAAQGAGRGGSDAQSGASSLLPARLRRLTNAEFDTSVRALLGVESRYGESFTPDTRQAGYSRNDAQRADPVFVMQVHDAAQKLADAAKEQVATLAPCSDSAGSEQCARDFIGDFATRAYRRPATDREIEALVTVYEAGAQDASYADGIATVISAVLQSPGFLYTTEIGEAPAGSDTQLTEHEIASALSYLLTGGPPDDALLQAAAAGKLHMADERSSQARRLLESMAASQQVVLMVQEWLGIDRIVQTAKDSNVYPEFAGLRDAMKREADDFTREVMWRSGGSDVGELFSADWTIAEDNLARMYLDGQAPTRDNDRVSLASVNRRGILNQGAFLAVHAHATESAPVLRGVSVLRRVLCTDIPSPTSLNINVVPPVPDPSKSTRERFAIHSQDQACQGCHQNIDAVGFSFEGFDGMGKARTMENGRAIDSTTTLMGGYSFDGDLQDSSELSTRIAASAELSSCLARQLFRFAAARSDEQATEPAAQFEAEASALPDDARGKLIELLVAFVSSGAFIERGGSP